VLLFYCSFFCFVWLLFSLFPVLLYKGITNHQRKQRQTCVYKKDSFLSLFIVFINIKGFICYFLYPSHSFTVPGLFGSFGGGCGRLLYLGTLPPREYFLLIVNWCYLLVLIWVVLAQVFAIVF